MTVTQKKKLKPGICQFCGAKTGQPNFFRCERHWNEGPEVPDASTEALMELAERVSRHPAPSVGGVDRELLAKTARRLQRSKEVLAGLRTSDWVN